jgi:putative endonuclease
MSYQVYVIRNENGRSYIGISEDVQKRLQQHNDGLSKWTSKFGPWALIWTSKSMSLSEARSLESLLKRQKGGSGLVTLLRLHDGAGS